MGNTINHRFSIDDNRECTIYIKDIKVGQVILTNHELDSTYGLIKLSMSLADFRALIAEGQQVLADIDKSNTISQPGLH